MNAEDLLAQVEALGVVVTVDEKGVVLRPRALLTSDLIETLRAHKDELRGLVELRGWPEASREAVRAFGVPHARLYPFVGKSVATPEGVGTLLQVVAERAVVLLDDACGGRRVIHLLPSELAPPGAGTARTGIVDGSVN